MPYRRRPLMIGVIVFSVAALLAVDRPALAGSAPPSNPPGSVAGQTRTVTLITGDRVVVTQHAGGKSSSSVLPAPGREHVGFQAGTADGHLTVVPGDAAGPLASGRLDRRLFDVTGLIDAGYEDSRTGKLPLIVTYLGSKAALVDPPGGHVVRALPSVNGTAVSISRKDSTRFWDQLGVARRTAFAGGVAKVWLDGKARISDDESNTQIGVPAAWRAGLTGTGVTVAVLDSGYDATHPDLRDAVVEAKDFTDSEDGTKDTVGHGTHVASIIAGSGTASAGKYTGVAPGAKVAVGRVCATDSCAESAIIAGMEWAAGRARVVNMSLGTSKATDGTDPIAAAANRLTADNGTLFVASAGNEYSAYSVASPASADSVLAVGSVNRDDARSDFSSQGPRAGDHAVKPDITAPGAGIVAARAAGTTIGDPVGDKYISASGTSMASPHVAGAAAILAQAHPDWKSDRLKAALMSSAAPAADLGVFAQGAGRVDVAQAIAQSVYAAGSVSFPRVPWPYSGQQPVVRTATYRNAGSTPVTLNLALSTQDGVGAALAIDATTVTVPANGQAEVRVTLTPSLLSATGGSLGGRIVATAPGIRLQTAVGVPAEPPSFDVAVKLIDRSGKPASDQLEHTVVLYNHTRQVDSDIDGQLVGGVAKMRVEPGTYDLFTRTATPKAGKPDESASTTQQAVLSVTVTEDRTITLDARKGRKVDVTVDRSGTARRALVTDLQILDGRVGRFEVAEADMYAVPVKPADRSAIRFATLGTLGPAKKPAKKGAEDYQYNVAIGVQGQIPANADYRVRTRDLAPVTVDFRAQGKPARAFLARSPEFIADSHWYGFGVFMDIPLPSRRREYFSTGGGQSWGSVIAAQRPPDQADPSSLDGFINMLGRQYRAGTASSEVWNKGVLGPSLVNSPNYGNAALRFDDQLVTTIPLLSPGTADQTNNPSQAGPFMTGSTTLSRDGTVLGSTDTPGSAFFSGLPDDNAAYTLATTATRASAWTDLSSRVDATWTFHSQRGGASAVPLLFAHITGGFDGLNQAPAGPFRLDVTVDRQAGSTSAATIAGVTMESSVDDGRTWQPVTVRGSGGSWSATVTNPRTGYVSLRTGVRDSAGESQQVTIIHAYKIKN